MVQQEVEANTGWDENGEDDLFDDSFQDSRGSDDDDDEFGGFDDEFDTSRRKMTKKQRNTKKGRKSSSRTTRRKKANKGAAPLDESSSDQATARKETVSSGPRWGMPEMFGMACVLLYGVVYFAGSSINERKASKWIEAFYPIVSKQFYMVGENVMDTSGDLDTRSYRNLLTKESQNNYRLYASGRENADALIASLELDPLNLFYLLWV